MKKAFLLILFFPFLLQAQTEKNTLHPFKIGVFNNATLLPGSGFAGLINTPLHLGLLTGTHFTYKKTDKSHFFQTLNLAYSYHRLAQHSIYLYSEAAWRRNFDCGFSIETMLGAGYLHAIPNIEMFELNENGEYERTGKFGRPQGMADINLGIGYLINKNKEHPIRIGLNYQVWFQFPFVQEYVPILPNTALHLSTTFFLSKKSSK